jgi:uncharacterized membrane protein
MKNGSKKNQHTIDSNKKKTSKIKIKNQKDIRHKRNFEKYIIYAVLSVMLIGIAFSVNKSTNKNFSDEEGFNTVKAQVIEMLFDNTDEKPEVEGANFCRYQEFRIKIKEGLHKEEIYTMRNTVETMEVYNIIVSKGDEIFVSISEEENGKITNLHIYDIARENYLYIFIGLFLILLLLIGGYKGAKSIITLLFTGFMVIKVLLPLILRGYNPILVSVFVCAVIIAVTIVIISGLNKKTVTAILGTLGGVVAAGVLALIIGNAASISGLANENSQSLAYYLKIPDFDFRGILFAGIIIGALGAVMDVSMSIASAMYEIEEVKPDISKRELLKSGMNIGRDIMGSMSNTLILAYTGGAIELMLLFMATGTKFREIINLDMVAAEVIRAVAGSIGLACTIPLTAIIAVSFKRKKSFGK